MAPRTKVTREQIVQAGLDLVRWGGLEALNARAVAAKLGCSTQPVFSNYADMRALERDVLAAADRLWQARMEAAAREGQMPPYKAIGMAYIAFAREEPALFRWLFMRDRYGEAPTDDRAENAGVIALIREKTGLSENQAWLFHLEMWLFVHGAAATLATGYVDWGEALVSDMLTDVFQGLLARFARKEEAQDGRH